MCITLSSWKEGSLFSSSTVGNLEIEWALQSVCCGVQVEGFLCLLRLTVDTPSWWGCDCQGMQGRCKVVITYADLVWIEVGT